MIVKCGTDIYLRELSENDDYVKILGIVRAYTAHSTRILYELYRKEKNFKYNMNDTFDKDFLSKLYKNFKHFDCITENKSITYKSDRFKILLKKIEEVFKYFPDDHLFSPYGPIQPPFDESVKEFLDIANDTHKNNGRRLFRMGIMKNDKLIGCFTIDFNKHKFLGFQNETTGDPGIFIDPAFRDYKGKRTWQYVFFMATKIVEEFFPVEKKEIEIGATTHRLNVETENILSEENKFKEFEGFVSHAKYGARRFFTIKKEAFITNFRKDMSDYQVVITE